MRWTTCDGRPSQTATENPQTIPKSMIVDVADDLAS